MSVSVAVPRASRRAVERPGAVRGFMRMVSLVTATFAALIGAIWWSSASTCATTVCRLDVPMAAVPQISKPVVASVSAGRGAEQKTITQKQAGSAKQDERQKP